MSSRRDPVLFRTIPDDEGQPPTCGFSMVHLLSDENGNHPLDGLHDPSEQNHAKNSVARRFMLEKELQVEIVNVAEVPEERPKLTQAEFAACMRDSLAQRWDRRVDNDKFLQKFFAEAKEYIKRREENSDQ